MNFFANLAIIAVLLAALYLLMIGAPIAAMLDAADRFARWSVRQWKFWIAPLKGELK
jgi:hypothetical protein